jgi:glycine/D-amino acid oxidase-like deaminating enzyme
VKLEKRNPKSGSSPKTERKQRKLKCAEASRKLTHPASASTKLRVLWRDSWSEEEQDYWREQFASPRSQADMREELRKRYHIDLVHDFSVTRFRRWVGAQDAREEEAQMAEADEAELKRQGLSGEQLRGILLARMTRRALARGDFNLGALAVRMDLQVEAMALRKEKFKESLRTKIQAGLAAILAEAKGNRAIAAAVKQIQKATE